MQGFSRTAAALVVLLAACSGDVDPAPGDDDGGNADAAPGGNPDADPGGSADAAAPTADARTDRFRCKGDPLPARADDPITVAGTVNGVGFGGATPIVGATVELFAAAGGGAMATATSAAGGAYSFDVATGGRPLNVYVRATSGSLMKTELWGATPTVADATSSNFALASLSNLNLFLGSIRVTQSGSLGAVTISVIDCDGNQVEGATVTGFERFEDSQGDPLKVFYAVGGQPNANATATSADGLAFVFNVPLGNVEINARVGGETLRAHSITTRAQTVTLTAVAP